MHVRYVCPLVNWVTVYERVLKEYKDGGLHRGKEEELAKRWANSVVVYEVDISRPFRKKRKKQKPTQEQVDKEFDESVTDILQSSEGIKRWNTTHRTIQKKLRRQFVALRKKNHDSQLAISLK